MNHPVYLILAFILLACGITWVVVEVRAMDRARARRQEPRPMEPDQIRALHQRIYQGPGYETFAARLERRVASREDQ